MKELYDTVWGHLRTGGGVRELRNHDCYGVWASLVRTDKRLWQTATRITFLRPAEVPHEVDLVRHGGLKNIDFREVDCSFPI